MTIYDQFDLVLSKELSGSQTSMVIVGRPALTSSIVGAATIYNVARRVVGDKSNLNSLQGLFTSSSTAYISKWRFTDWFNLQYNRTYVGSNKNIVKFSPGVYYDSIMPDIIRVFKTLENSTGFLSINNAATYEQILGDRDLEAQSFPTGSAINVNFPNSFLKAFPFQTNLKRLTKNLSNNRLTITLNDGVDTANQFGLMRLPYYTADSYFISDVSASNITPTSWVLSSLGFSSNQQLPYKMSDYRKFVFGAGNGPFDLFNSDTTTGSMRTKANYNMLPTFIGAVGGDPYWAFGMTLRGFRYGVLNANPVSPKYVFSRKHFGHIRDLLEAPFQTALYNSDASINYPVTVTFLSGTALYNSASQYLSASSEQSFNRYDSGQWDIHARVGQPFYDIDNTD